ncbi:allergen Tha p 1-like [Coccinella septempunctata]|uniref:allergen Tha p 1-like n=1 Tax=Coccinella septempunctata TaxID=41139 RepID=UPI001D08413E|nr:allergen Tha p 1-like [Coccinella septempunctata]
MNSILPVLAIVLTFFSINGGFCMHVKLKRMVETYPTKYDNIDVNAILASERLLKNYMNCLLDKGSCSPEGKILRQYLPDAMQSECSRCSEKQKKIAGTVLAHLLQYHKDYWQQLLNKYDTDGSFIKKHQGFAPGEAEDYSDLDETR